MSTTTRPRACIAGVFVWFVACGGGDGGTDSTSSSGPASLPTADGSSSSDAAPTTSTGGPASTSTSTPGTTGGLDETADPSTTAASAPASSESGEPDMGGPQCLAATAPCAEPADCCQDQGLTCATTTLGQVCCGLEGTACATANGEDCCGDLLCTAGACIAPGAVPKFQAPFPCGQSWTYSHHSQEVRRALDFIDNGGNTDGAPCLAALDGVATRHVEGGAGNYIIIDHGGGWTTYYFHLQAFSVEDNTFVTQGQEIGKVGSTGNSSGAHIHFEELLYGEGQDIWLDGQPLAPYPGNYGQASAVSANCP
jgi:hypothetical protein